MSAKIKQYGLPSQASNARAGFRPGMARLPAAVGEENRASQWCSHDVGSKFDSFIADEAGGSRFQRSFLSIALRYSRATPRHITFADQKKKVKEFTNGASTHTGARPDGSQDQMRVGDRLAKPIPVERVWS